MMFSTKTKVIFISLISAFTLSTGAYACSLDGWSSSSGAIDVGQPFGASAPDINGVSRFEELCALQVTGTGRVDTDSPSHTRVRGRAYFYPDNFSGSNDSDVLVAFDGTATELFSISWNNGTWVVSAAGGGSASTAATGGYDLVEFDWDPSGSGNLDLWVNADATTDGATLSVGAGPTATLESISVGLPNGFNGNTGDALFVDSVELHNETAIGPVFNCDADPNSTIEVEDAVAIVDEIFLVAVATGTPDCDSNGLIEVEDAVAVVDIIFAP